MGMPLTASPAHGPTEAQPAPALSAVEGGGTTMPADSSSAGTAPIVSIDHGGGGGGNFPREPNANWDAGEGLASLSAAPVAAAAVATAAVASAPPRGPFQSYPPSAPENVQQGIPSTFEVLPTADGGRSVVGSSMEAAPAV
ncbi:unnamed protein product, partial [Laminaria digitata]